MKFTLVLFSLQLKWFLTSLHGKWTKEKQKKWNDKRFFAVHEKNRNHFVCSQISRLSVGSKAQLRATANAKNAITFVILSLSTCYAKWFIKKISLDFFVAFCQTFWYIHINLTSSNLEKKKFKKNYYLNFLNLHQLEIVERKQNKKSPLCSLSWNELE